MIAALTSPCPSAKATVPPEAGAAYISCILACLLLLLPLALAKLSSIAGLLLSSRSSPRAARDRRVAAAWLAEMPRGCVRRTALSAHMGRCLCRCADAAVLTHSPRHRGPWIPLQVLYECSAGPEAPLSTRTPKLLFTTKESSCSGYFTAQTSDPGAVLLGAGSSPPGHCGASARTWCGPCARLSTGHVPPLPIANRSAGGPGVARPPRGLPDSHPFPRVQGWEQALGLCLHGEEQKA